LQGNGRVTLLSLREEIRGRGVIREGLGSIARSVAAPLLSNRLGIHICNV